MNGVQGKHGKNCAHNLLPLKFKKHKKLATSNVLELSDCTSERVNSLERVTSADKVDANTSGCIKKEQQSDFLI